MPGREAQRLPYALAAQDVARERQVLFCALDAGGRLSTPERQAVVQQRIASAVRSEERGWGALVIILSPLLLMAVMSFSITWLWRYARWDRVRRRQCRPSFPSR